MFIFSVGIHKNLQFSLLHLFHVENEKPNYLFSVVLIEFNLVIELKSMFLQVNLLNPPEIRI